MEPANAKQLFLKLQSLKTLTGDISAHIGSCCDVLGKTNTRMIDKLPIGKLPIGKFPKDTNYPMADNRHDLNLFNVSRLNVAGLTSGVQFRRSPPPPAPLAATTGQGPPGLGTVVAGWAIGCEPLFAASLVATTGPGPAGLGTVVVAQLGRLGRRT